MSSITTIRLSRTFPNGIILGWLITPPAFILTLLLLLNLFFMETMEEVIGSLIALLVVSAFLTVGLLPILSFDFVIINKDDKTIHFCTKILGLFKDRKPVSYVPLTNMMIKQNTRTGTIQTRYQPDYQYKVKHNDILLYDDTHRKKLLIKNAGKGEKALNVAKRIADILNIPFDEKKPE